MLDKVKEFAGKNRGKIGVVVGLLAVAGIGLWVGDLTLTQVMACVGSFDPSSAECAALSGS